VVGHGAVVLRHLPASAEEAIANGKRPRGRGADYGTEDGYCPGRHPGTVWAPPDTSGSAV